jgi:zinc D-Ala-D-Ala carboxypeptidase
VATAGTVAASPPGPGLSGALTPRQGAVTLRAMKGLLVLLGLVVAGCGAATPSPSGTVASYAVAPATSTSAVLPSATPSPVATAEPSSTATPTTQPSPTPSVSAFAVTNTLPLPSCTYDLDVPTPFASQESWALTLVDALYSVPADYVPAHLVSASPAGLGGFWIRSEALPDLMALTATARASGIALGVVSTYRDYIDQQETFRHWAAILGSDVYYGSARAGHSEHQLGVALDFTVPGHMPWDYYSFERDTPAGKWLAANAWRFGFVMSYPWKGHNTITCYGYEPWHYRYVGRAEAAAVRSSGLTLRQWLWLRQPIRLISDSWPGR